MIEILPDSLSQGVQVVGLRRVSQRWRPVRILLAFETPERDEGRRLREIWIQGGPQAPFPLEALEDLLMDGSKASIPPNGKALSQRGCPICNEKTARGVFTPEGRTLCRGHLWLAWDKALADGGRPAERPPPCPLCREPSLVLWSDGSSCLCTRCLVKRRIPQDSSWKWIFHGGKVLPWGMRGELRIFLGLWSQNPPCERCGSPHLRIRKIALDFPKMPGPLYPLWEIFRNDRTEEGEARRMRQLRAYTQGLIRAVVECPQCGYLEREWPDVLQLFPGNEEDTRVAPSRPAIL
jgi:hypothetical protein